MAEIYIRLENYTDAAGIFSRLANSCSSENVLRFKANSYLINALICILAQNDIVAAKKSMENFCATNYLFATSSEYKFVEEVINAIENTDVQHYKNIISEYDHIHKLTDWQIHILAGLVKEMETTSLV